MKQFVFSKKLHIRLLRHLTFWAVILFALVLNHTVGDDNTWKNFTLQNILQDFVKSLDNYISFKLLATIPYTYFVVYYLRPKFLPQNRYLPFVIGFILATIADFVLVLGLIYLYSHLKPLVFPEILFQASKVFLITYPVYCLTFLCIKLFKTWYEKEDEKQVLIKAKTEAEMELLKAQIHPHFLFNTLNNIYSFTLIKSPVAEELVLSLSEIMKYMVHDCNVEMIALDKEIKMLKHYIALEKVRYGNRLDIQIDIEGEYEDKAVTPLLMIPFVENCFKHGASKELQHPWIKLFIQVDENVLHFQLVNGKPAFTSKKDVKNGIGLINAKKRPAGSTETLSAV